MNRVWVTREESRTPAGCFSLKDWQGGIATYWRGNVVVWAFREEVRHRALFWTRWGREESTLGSRGLKFSGGAWAGEEICERSTYTDVSWFDFPSSHVGLCRWAGAMPEQAGATIATDWGQIQNMRHIAGYKKNFPNESVTLEKRELGIIKRKWLKRHKNQMQYMGVVWNPNQATQLLQKVFLRTIMRFWK